MDGGFRHERNKGNGIFRSLYKATSDTADASRDHSRERAGHETSLGRIFEGGVRWRVVFLAGAVAGVSPFVFSIFLINVYVTTEWLANEYFDGVIEAMAGGSGAAGFGVFMGRFGTPALSLAAVVGAAMFVGRRVGPSAMVHGFLIGVFAVVAVNAATVPFFGAPEPYEILTYPVVFIGGGILGGMKGWEIRAGEDALHRANRAVGAATSPGDVAGAIGENLTGSNVNGVSLWTLRLGEPGSFEPLGKWTAGGRKELHPETGFGTTRELSRTEAPIRVRVSELSGPDKAVWGKRGVKSGLLLPLASGEGAVRLMVITAGRGRGFSKRDERAYSTVAATASLALENLRLVEEAKDAGKRAGILDERQRLAHEIHDTLAQGFTSIVTNLEAAEGSDESRMERHLSVARSIARESLAEARRLVWALRPGQLEDAPLPEAVRSLVERWSSDTGVPAEAVITGEPRPIPAEVEATAVRVAGEALANIGKHAKAGRAAITLSYMPDSLTLDARDDGVGFNTSSVDGKPSEDGGGFGLRAMRERVEKVGGTLSIESEVGEGVSLSVEMPIMAGKAVRP
ncbi:MAG: GAF domain-containing sensor histidine kinase [Actinomycetota bacterium]|nr:GAF domain-containing sensor histidine kinase [Actinomycetota bacterium]